MAVVNLTATKYSPDASVGNGIAGTVKVLAGHFIVGSADSATSTYSLGKIPSNARILGSSCIDHDDLASTGSPTFDIGLFAVNGNITDDDDALNDGIDVASAAGARVPVVQDISNYGKAAWTFVSGASTDPGGDFEVKITLKDAAVNVGGDVSYDFYYLIP